MAFKTTGGDEVALDDPEAMFRDFRGRTIMGPLGHQSEIVRAYVDTALNDEDVAFQLPTGSGKTLVALLVAEWRRRRDGLTVVYLAPTNQLVNQVAEQALTKYGMEVCPFTGSKREYDPKSKAKYTTGEAIAVTTYSALFNINPFFESPDLIVLDDAHAADNYIAGNWSLSVRREDESHSRLFHDLTDALRDLLSTTDFTRLTDDSRPFDPADYAWVGKLPTPSLVERADTLTDIIDDHADRNPDLKFRWSLLRGSLAACHIFFSRNEILIRPLTPPTRMHSPFSGARQRLYMSATLGAGGELERITGVSPIRRLPVPKGWDKQGTGRRFFIFPNCSLEDDESYSLTQSAIEETSRTLILTTRTREAERRATEIEQELGYKVFRAHELERSKSGYCDTENAVAIVANRYDGIDLVDDECRLLIVDGLPRTLNLYEKFMVTRIGASSLFTDRVLTRVVQAVGRCTRSANDYAAVIVLGEELNNFLLKPDNRRLLHPELQGELAFGVEQSTDTKFADFLDNLRLFFGQTQEWREADREIVRHRKRSVEEPIPGVDDLQDSAPYELEYQYAMWRHDYEGALDGARAVLSRLRSPELRGYRAFWSYLAGSAAWLAYNGGLSGMDRVAREFFSEAAKANYSIRWLAKLRRVGLQHGDDGAADDRLLAVIERLERRLEAMGLVRNSRFDAEVEAIVDGLGQNEAGPFEDAQRRLGMLLGYEADNSGGTADPDPWWIANEHWCLVFEDHSNANADGQLGANKVRQATSHASWIRANVSALAPEAVIVVALVTPRAAISRGALPHAGDTGHWSLSDFRCFADTAVTTLRELRNSFPGAGDLAWRATAAGMYEQRGLDPASLEARVLCNPLADLRVAD